MNNGTVKWFNAAKRIMDLSQTTLTGEDVFVHFSGIAGRWLQDLLKRDRK